MTEEPSSAILTPPPDLLGNLVVRASGRSDLGTKHHVNEDRFAVSATQSGGALLVLCDGMGGMGSGDKASQAAVDLITEWVAHDASEDIVGLASSAIRQADIKVMRSLAANDGRKPGTTCACVVVRGGLAYLLWVGDSSILLIRDGNILVQSRPHRMVQDLVDAGTMTKEQALRSPMRHYLSRSLGGRDDETPVEPEVRRPVRLKKGDRLVLCSDGLTDFLEHDEIAAIVSGHSAPDDALDQLIALALSRKVDDNVTCIVAHVDAEGAFPDAVGSAWDVAAVNFDLEQDFQSDIRERPANLNASSSTEAPPSGPSPGRQPWWIYLAGGALAGAIVLCAIVLTALLFRL